jgi:hypothetical protein
MQLETGTRLLHYELVEKIGEGGMGVVWRARDTGLDRDVAIKVLPRTFADDPERLIRFEREAKLLATLNHPNIATVYGFHQAGDGSNSLHFIAMEHVSGEDLAQRVARGPMPLDEAIPIARKVALGMSAAHESGTIHRDLKPANVRITPAGEVKVLDFGLARAMESVGDANTANSPTITSAGTAAGMLLGTAAYMSPEQARGRVVDRRADVWAFGCVLYECLTGSRTFPGDTISDILAELIKSEPDWKKLPASTPTAVRRLLRRCLAKDPDDRLRDLGDAVLELAETDETAVPDALETISSRPAGVSRVLAAVGVLAALALGLLLGSAWVGDGTDAPAVAAARPPATAGIIELPAAAPIAYGSAPIGYDSPMLTVSADGRYVVYVGRNGEGSRLYRHDLSTFKSPEPISGTEGALHAFFAPDEPSVGFVTNDKLARVDLNGDRLQNLGDVRSATRAIWGRDGYIYVGDAQSRLIRRFPEAGGEAELMGEIAYHGLTDVLPDGSGALVQSRDRTMRAEYGSVGLYDFATQTTHVLLENAYDARLLGDRIFFVRGPALLAARFDPKRREVLGEPEILVRDVAVDSIFGQAQVALSASGTLVYLPGGDRSLGTIAWCDRDGRRGTLPVEPRVYGVLDLDPSDRRIAVHVGDVSDYIWIYDLDRQEGRKVPTNVAAGWPVWNSAGDSITYTAMGETYKLVRQMVDSKQAPRVLLDSTEFMAAASWSPDDRLIAIGGQAIQVLDENGQQAAETIAGFMPQFSPDGRWLAHNSEQGGVYETIVRSWPEGDRAYSIQTEGGIESAWSRRGELFYRLGDRWYVVETTSGDTFSWTPPRLAFEIPFLDTPGRSYDVTSDGQRLYTIVQAVDDVEDRIHVVGGLLAP